MTWRQQQRTEETERENNKKMNHGRTGTFEEYTDFYSTRALHASRSQEKNIMDGWMGEWMNAFISNQSKRLVIRWMMWLESKHYLYIENLPSIIGDTQNTALTFLSSIWSFLLRLQQKKTKHPETNPLKRFDRSTENIYIRTKERIDFCSELGLLSCWRQRQHQRRRRR